MYGRAAGAVCILICENPCNSPLWRPAEETEQGTAMHPGGYSNMILPTNCCKQSLQGLHLQSRQEVRRLATQGTCSLLSSAEMQGRRIRSTGHNLNSNQAHQIVLSRSPGPTSCHNIEFSSRPKQHLLAKFFGPLPRLMICWHSLHRAGADGVGC